MKNSKLTGGGVKEAERPPRQFTVEEANRALPLARRIVADIVQHFGPFDELQQQRVAGSAPARRNEGDELHREIEAAATRLNDLIAELRQIGCELKDPRIGLIDFPAVHEGRDVLLCWRDGEEKVGFWHEVHTGFPGRRPIAELADSKD